MSSRCHVLLRITLGECPSQQKTLLEDCLKEMDERKENRNRRPGESCGGASVGGRGEPGASKV